MLPELVNEVGVLRSVSEKLWLQKEFPRDALLALVLGQQWQLLLLCLRQLQSLLSLEPGSQLSEVFHVHL